MSMGSEIESTYQYHSPMIQSLFGKGGFVWEVLRLTPSNLTIKLKIEWELTFTRIA